MVAIEEERRTGFVDRLLEAPGASALERAEKECERRREDWLKRWGRIAFDHDMIDCIKSSFEHNQRQITGVFLWMPLYVPFFLIRKALGFGKTARLVRALRCRECPDCGYNLRSIPTFVGGDPTVIGPPVCPECGSPWPLVPSPNAGEPPAPSAVSPVA